MKTNPTFAERYEDRLKAIVEALGAEWTPAGHHPVCNEAATGRCRLGVASLRVSISEYTDTCGVEVDFTLPEKGVTANAFMDHCAAIEKTPKNHHGEYRSGPAYADWVAELNRKQTFACSPWDNNYFYVRSTRYPLGEIDQAIGDAVALARQFASHIDDYPSLRRWKSDDPEVTAMAGKIIANASLRETGVDPEERCHFLRDENSFIKGWFHPFYDNGRGAFDTAWPSSTDYAAGCIAQKGSFEYAVACVVLNDPEYIAKGRKACIIREESRTVRY